MLGVHTCRAVDRFRAIAAGVRRSAFSLGVVPPLLLLIPSPEANERYTRSFPPFFYRCENGQTLVSRVEYEDQMGTGRLLAVYPYPIDERQEVLWITKGRQYIAVGGQEYDCKAWKRRYDDGSAWGIPDPAALREYAKRFNKAGKYRYICGEHTVLFRITDFLDGGLRHGVMEVDDQEVVGLSHSRGNSGNFNGKASSEPGISFAWGIHTGDDNKPVIKWFLSIDDQTFTCNRGGY